MLARLLSMPEAAARLGVPVPRAYGLARQGLLPSGVVVRLGRQIRIDEEALAAWIKAGGKALPGGWKREPDD